MDMKKLLVLFAVIAFFSGCSKQTIEDSRLQMRGEQVFAPNETTPFSGRSEAVYENGQLAISKEWKNGIPDGKHEEWFENGIKALEAEYSDGNIISYKVWNVLGEQLTQVQVKGDSLVGKNFWTTERDEPFWSTWRYEVIVKNGFTQIQDLESKSIDTTTDESTPIHVEAKTTIHFKDGYPISGSAFVAINGKSEHREISYNYQSDDDTVEVIRTRANGDIESSNTVPKSSLYGAVFVKNGMLFNRGYISDLKTDKTIYGIRDLSGFSKDYQYEVFFNSDADYDNSWSIGVKPDGNAEFQKCIIDGEHYYSGEYSGKDLNYCELEYGTVESLLNTENVKYLLKYRGL